MLNCDGARLKIPNINSLVFCYQQVEALHKMDDSYFGEGLTLLGERFVKENLFLAVLLSCLFSKLCGLLM